MPYAIEDNTLGGEEAGAGPADRSMNERIQILVDTREKTPWSFDPEKFEVITTTLQAGDYSLDGLDHLVAIERKSLGDFVSTVIHDWLRFRKELNRLSGYTCTAIVVETDLEKIFEHRYESEALPASVLGRMNAIYIETGIPVLLWGNATLAADMASRFLTLAWRKLS